MKRILSIIVASVVLAGCGLLRTSAALAATPAAQQVVYCNVSTLAACNSLVNPGNGTQGDAAYVAFGKVNANFTTLFDMFGLASNLATNGTVAPADIAALWTGCSSTAPALGYQGACVAGGGGSMVYPGAGIPLSTGTGWGTSYSTSGTGSVALTTSPVFTTPSLGVPSAISLVNATALTLPVGAINATGTPSATTFLAGNGTWAVPAGGGTVTTTGTPTTGTIAAFSGSTSITNATAQQLLSLVNSQVCNAQTGTTYTFVLSDANNCVTMANAAANTVTIPANATVAFPVGTTLTVVQNGAGATTVAGVGSPVTLESAKYGSSTTQTYVFPSEFSCLALQKTATDTWFVSSCDYNPGGGSGTVTDGAGTTTANELLASTTTAHAYSIVATLPTAAMPALAGDLTGTAGSLSVTVAKVNGGAVPASATVLGSNSSSQLIAASTVTYLIDTGTAFTLGTGTGACATASVVSAGAANGEVTCTGTTGASTLVVNLPTATHGWACTANDITAAAVIPESAFTATSATFSGSVTASNDIVLQCTGF